MVLVNIQWSLVGSTIAAASVLQRSPTPLRSKLQAVSPHTSLVGHALATSLPLDIAYNKQVANFGGPATFWGAATLVGEKQLSESLYGLQL
jgi:hypothetical protein